MMGPEEKIDEAVAELRDFALELERASQAGKYLVPEAVGLLADKLRHLADVMDRELTYLIGDIAEFSEEEGRVVIP